MTDHTQKNIAILGSTGSVGEQAIDVAERMAMRISAISANRNYKRVEEQVRQFGIGHVAMAEESAAKELKIRLADTPAKIYCGAEGICDMIRQERRDVVLNSIIGKAGLLPTLAAIDSGARLALANKESLVVAGEIVSAQAKSKNVEILPVDSEHSAIFQCLKAGADRELKKIYLTASGGPFFGYTAEQLKGIGVQETLAHPTWKMGAKITVDSATLMNKGFEVIEAVHLFGVSADRIEVVIHRESIIHSMVEYIDNSVIAQLSVPDMRLCAQYALTYPERTEAVIPELNLFEVAKLTFAKPDTKTFALLQCAIDCIGTGGGLPAVLNAANEVAVAEFLQGRLPFYAIAEVVGSVVKEMAHASDVHDLDGILLCDHLARAKTRRLLKIGVN
ncbi:MAG: 1-deoxy-D-xylulose-5-phosphate reductoisomerase [Ruminococcaceae bacterium]|nr:1-deoxy-D-xylulose-5-phosphate reductoisomerase [Oscillospiraceae bacterium]